MESEFEGTVEGDSIKGVFKSDRGNRDANATRVGAKSEPPKAEPNKPASPPPPRGPAKPDAPKPK